MGRGPSTAHLLKHKNYSTRQIRRKKRTLCEKFNEIAIEYGLPENHLLRSAEFAAGNKT